MKKNNLLGTVATCATALALAFTLTACRSSKSYTFNVTTGDAIEVALDTSGGLDLEQDNGSFSVKQGDQTIVDGLFITANQRDAYVSAVESDTNAEITSNTDELFAWTYDNGTGTIEHNRIISVDGTDQTYVMCGSIATDETAMNAAFDAITVSLDNE